ncbi:MAG TPA: site-specific DNA-methyltransferase, partial [Pirellulales bacterium]|nr:site-specific DNA-methyltransferase [Pirellulales bacterium]
KAAKTSAKHSARAEVEEYRHREATRKNNPPAKIAAEGRVPPLPKAQYSYSPRRPPELRFDAAGGPDRARHLLEEATRRVLSPDEAQTLADALACDEPWLEWAGKREQKQFEVDPVALHIHERVSTQAILRSAAREDVQRSLFADPQQSYREAVQFYRHDIAWTNRLILGDSLQVMSSLARREDLSGKVQMIYLDPPYGIKFASNFQPEIGRRDVKDKEQDLTREAEMVKAFRDTWHLGVHSYLSYLRDRLILARELLADSGSIFVQIGEENLHRVRSLLDDIFGADNFLGQITFRTTASLAGRYLSSNCDFLLWYGRDVQLTKFRKVYRTKGYEDDVGNRYTRVELADGTRAVMSTAERGDPSVLPPGARIYRHDNLTSQGATPTTSVAYEFEGQSFNPGANSHWKTRIDGMDRLAAARRLAAPTPFSLAYIRYLDDFAVSEHTTVWADTQTGAFTDPKVYAVQTNAKVIARCLLMTTDPGDLVLDPTCGSGTTAYVAEQWGRRWITIDTSRVALAIARQRLLTAKFDYYKLRPITPEERQRNPHGTWLSDPVAPDTVAPTLRGGDADTVRAGASDSASDSGNAVGWAERSESHHHLTFQCKAVPHITLKSIAQNTNLDPIFARHAPTLEERLAACNRAMAKVSDSLRTELLAKLAAKQRAQGARSITDADRRRWVLPAKGDGTRSVPATEGWQHWQVPFDTDNDWPKELIAAVQKYREAWRAKMDEVNACIAANAESEELVDQPEVVRGVVRVSGPFTVEAVQPPELSLAEATVIETSQPEFEGAPEELPSGFLSIARVEVFNDVQNLSAYLEHMVRLLRQDGVRFPNNKQMRFTRLEPIFESGSATGIHAEGRWTPVNGGRSVGNGLRAVPPGDAADDGPANVGVTFGPQYGPVTAKQVEELIKPASRRYDDLVIAGFSFDGPAQQVIEEAQHPKLRVHMAHIRPDVNPAMTGLLKEQPGNQLFTVFGQPRTSVKGPDKRGEYVVRMEGVDIYNPVDNSITATGADKVAAWFLDSDYDGRTFCITQAFFPDRSAWDKLARALGDVVDAAAFAAYSGTVSLPFAAGEHRRVAVKAIDPRGNEVMQTHILAPPSDLPRRGARE